MRISAEEVRQRLLPILSAQAVGLVCGIIGVRLTSQLVDPAHYGIYGVFVSLASIGVSVVYAGLIKFVSRNWQGAEDRAGLLREVIAAGARKIPWLVAASAAATLVVAAEHRVIYALLLLGCALLLAFVQLAQSALQAGREHWRDFGLSAGMSVIRSFAPPLLYAATAAGTAALFSGFLLHALYGILAAGWVMRRWWTGGPAGPNRRSLTPVYEGPRFVVLAIAGWILLGLNRWLFAWFFGVEVAGYFTLAANIGAILPTMLGMAMLQYFQPQWFAAPAGTAGERRQLLRRVDQAALACTVMGILLAAAVHAVMPVLIGPLVSERYVAAAEFVLATGSFATALAIGLYYHALLLAARREHSCSVVDLSGAACLILGGTICATAGMQWLQTWLLVSPLVPWVVNRPLARRAILDGKPRGQAA